ncbi:hypothetical protein GCM10007860_03280 [Chitiniphilus shinanonensis]|uniref:Family 19 chitinase n=1 Tax=Chitiniphilus shinanonensis TaxID=553088 RepID=F8WSX8_9NEIS|nr:glycoside hydrolase family 19 protein [Chitiniphilus shinanonensis]BAK53965.1 family 19 chitinase [Chitiniphilus shinanonensis]GLS03185.1 hypothetical protein GCM10007860_03280 [Chitiniphilus shinanonensis]
MDAITQYRAWVPATLLAALLGGALLPAVAVAAQQWAEGNTYTAGTVVTYNGRDYRALVTHSAYVGTNWNPAATPTLWQDIGPASGGGTPTPTPGPSPTPTPATPSPGGGGTCGYAAWNAGAAYTGGQRVSYNGTAYEAKWWTQGENPAQSGQWGVWKAVTCSGTPGPTPTPTPGPTPTPSPGGFVVSESDFNRMFPGRNSFYSYSGLVQALSAYPQFANTGSDTTKRQEAAAFLANINHETGGLVYIVEQNQANWPLYCDPGSVYACAPGKQYYGRGPMQLSWNFNYGAAGAALGLPLLADPDLVARDSAVAWKTAIWYWMTQSGPGTMTPHNAIVNGAGFGETIRSINGSLECGGRNPAQVQSRVNAYLSFTQILGVTSGNNLSC